MNADVLVALVRGGQLFSACAWLMVSHHYAGSAWRIANRRALWWDAAGCWAFVLGIVQSGFTFRWLFLDGGVIPVMEPVALSVWFVLYIANGGCAVGILHTWRHRDRDIPGSDRRARQGLAMWAGVLISASGLMWALA